MAVYSKSRSQLLYDIETTFGSDPAVAAAISLPIVTVPDLKITQDPIQSPALGGANRNPRIPMFGDMNSNCGLTFMMELTAIGHLLKSLLGSPSTVNNGDGTYTHTFKIGNTISSFLLDKGFTDGNLFYKYNGLVSNGLSFSAAPGDSGINYTLNILGGGYETKDTSAYDAAPSDLSRPSSWVFKPDITLTEGGSSNDAITDFSLDFSSSVELIQGLNGAGKATGYTVSSPQVSGTIRSSFNGDTLLLKGRNHTESSLAITFTDSVQSPNHSLVITLPEIKYGQANPEIDGPGIAYFTQAWISYYQDNADETALKMVLTNATASY